MELCRTIDEVRGAVRAARAAGRTIGCVPTMGALHEGHAALIDASVGDGHFTVVTIFVNPTQFGPNEDFARYPRTPEQDLQLCAAHGAAAVFMPPVAEMYPRDALTTVSVARLADWLCGASRPGHFAGVCTVVTKLFHIVLPDAAYFGQKDAQQAAIIRRMARDLDFPVEIVVRPTVREPDGLAKSSRNVYLTPEQREQAPSLHGALQHAARLIAEGQTDAAAIVQAMRADLRERAPDGEVDYVAIVDPDELQPVEQVAGPVLIALAVRFGRTRLIDNILVDAPPTNT